MKSEVILGKPYAPNETDPAIARDRINTAVASCEAYKVFFTVKATEVTLGLEKWIVGHPARSRKVSRRRR